VGLRPAIELIAVPALIALITVIALADIRLARAIVARALAACARLAFAYLLGVRARPVGRLRVSDDGNQQQESDGKVTHKDSQIFKA
jgi:hypothetical protein